VTEYMLWGDLVTPDTNWVAVPGGTTVNVNFDIGTLLSIITPNVPNVLYAQFRDAQGNTSNVVSGSIMQDFNPFGGPILVKAVVLGKSNVAITNIGKKFINTTETNIWLNAVQLSPNFVTTFNIASTGNFFDPVFPTGYSPVGGETPITADASVFHHFDGTNPLTNIKTVKFVPGEGVKSFYVLFYDDLNRPSVTKSFSVILDQTIPAIITANNVAVGYSLGATNYTAQTTKLRLRVQASDNLSGIEHYTYTVYEIPPDQVSTPTAVQTGAIYFGQSNFPSAANNYEADFTINQTLKTQGQKYYFIVTAFDGAGNESLPLTTEPMGVDSYLNFPIEPVVNYPTNIVINRPIVDVDFYDKESGISLVRIYTRTDLADTFEGNVNFTQSLIHKLRNGTIDVLQQNCTTTNTIVSVPSPNAPGGFELVNVPSTNCVSSTVSQTINFFAHGYDENWTIPNILWDQIVEGQTVRLVFEQIDSVGNLRNRSAFTASNQEQVQFRKDITPPVIALNYVSNQFAFNTPQVTMSIQTNADTNFYLLAQNNISTASFVSDYSFEDAGYSGTRNSGWVINPLVGDNAPIAGSVTGDVVYMTGAALTSIDSLDQVARTAFGGNFGLRVRINLPVGSPAFTYSQVTWKGIEKNIPLDAPLSTTTSYTVLLATNLTDYAPMNQRSLCLSVEQYQGVTLSNTTVVECINEVNNLWRIMGGMVTVNQGIDRLVARVSFVPTKNLYDTNPNNLYSAIDPNKPLYLDELIVFKGNLIIPAKIYQNNPAQNQNKSVTMNMADTDFLNAFTMTLAARDQVGNWSFVTKNVYVDFTTPSMTQVLNVPYAPGINGINYAGQFTVSTSSLRIRLDASDGQSGSGIRRYWFKVVNERTGIRIYPSTSEWQGISVLDRNFPLTDIIVSTGGSSQGIPALAAPLRLDGLYRVYAYAEDYVSLTSNVVTSDTVIIDNKAPVASFVFDASIVNQVSLGVYDYSGWYNNPYGIGITVSAIDNWIDNSGTQSVTVTGSGVTTINFVINDGPTQSVTAINGSAAFRLTNDGLNTFKYWAQDALGQQGTITSIKPPFVINTSITIGGKFASEYYGEFITNNAVTITANLDFGLHGFYLDTLPPTINSNLHAFNDIWRSSSFRPVFNTDDLGDGVRDIFYQIDNETPQTLNIDATSIGDPEPYYDHFITRANYFPYGIQNADLIVTLNLLVEDGKDILLRVRDTTTENVLVRLRGSIAGNKLTLLRVNSSVVSQSATLGGGVFSILHPNDSHLVTTLAYSYNGTSKVLTLTIPDKGLGSVYVPVYYPFRRAIDPLSAEGFHVFTYWAADKFNHVSSPNVVPILKIDRGEPHVTIDLGSSVQGRWVTANTGIPVNLIVEDLFATAVTFNPSNYPLADQINSFVTMPAPGFPSARPGSGPTQAKIWVNTTANAMPAMTFINEDLLATGNRGQFGFYGNAIVTSNGVNYLSYQAYDLAGNSNALPIVGFLNSSLVTAQVLFDATHNVYVIYPIYNGDQGVIRDLKLDNSAPNGGSLAINKYASHASYNLLPSYTSTRTVVINLDDLRDSGIGVRYIYITGDVVDNLAPLTTFRNPSPNATGPDQFDSSIVKPAPRAFAPVNRWFELPLNKLNLTLDHDPDSVNGMVREAVLWPLRDHLNTKVYVTITPGDGPKQIQIYTGDDFVLGNPIFDPSLDATQLIPADSWRINHMALLGSQRVTYDTQVSTPQITVLGKTIDNFIGTANVSVKIDIAQLNDLSGIDAVYLDGDIGGSTARTWISYVKHPSALGTANFMLVTVNLNALENTKNISVKIRDRAGNMWTMLETNFANHSKNESALVTTNVFYDTPMLCNQNIDRKITWSLDGKPNYFWFRTPTWDITIDCGGANRLVVSGDVKTFADGITVNDAFGIDFKSSNRLYLNDNVDGLKDIYFRMIDRSTQSDLSHQFVMLDRVNPVVTSNAQNISFYTDFLGAKIGITAYDPKAPSVNEVSNIKYIVYRINNDVPQTINFDSVPIPAGTSVTVSVTINITSEGINNTLRYYAVDKAGNAAPEIVISGIKVNRTPPIGQYVRSLTGKLFNNSYYTNSNRVTLDILAFDTDVMDISGDVVGAPYQVAYASKKEITLTPGEGTKNISITFRDQFFSDPNTFNVRVVYDTTAPAAPQITSQVPTLSSVAAVIITGNIEAYASIISSQLVTSNMLTPTSYRAAFKILPGSNLISFSARDLAGNLSVATQVTVTLNPLAWVETGSGDLPAGVADVSIAQVPSSQPQVMIANQYQAQTNPGAQSYLSDTIRDFNLIASMGYDAQALVNVFAQEEISIVIPFSNQAASQGKPKQFRIFYLNPATNRWELVPGDQVVDLATKTVKTRVSHFSTYAILELTPASVDNGLAQIFPNPFIAGDGNANNGEFGAGQGVFFDNMTAGADIKIYTISGALVKKLTATGSGDALWDVRNEAGEQVASGIYLYSIVGSNTKKVGRITVVRK